MCERTERERERGRRVVFLMVVFIVVVFIWVVSWFFSELSW